MIALNREEKTASSPFPKKINKQEKPEFGAKLRKYLDGEGITYAFFATKIGITPMRLQRIFGGSALTLAEGLAIAGYFDVRPEMLQEVDELKKQAA